MQKTVSSTLHKWAMHLMGLLTTASTLKELDEMLLSCVVVLSSPCRADIVDKHLHNLGTMMDNIGQQSDDVTEKDCGAPDNIAVNHKLEIHTLHVLLVLRDPNNPSILQLCVFGP